MIGPPPPPPVVVEGLGIGAGWFGDGGGVGREDMLERSKVLKVISEKKGYICKWR